MTKGKTKVKYDSVVYINIGERQLEDIQGIDVIVTTKDNTKILYNNWYMTTQTVPIEVLQEIRQEIDNIRNDTLINHVDNNRVVDVALEIIDKHIKEIEG